MQSDSGVSEDGEGEDAAWEASSPPGGHREEGSGGGQEGVAVLLGGWGGRAVAAREGAGALGLVGGAKPSAAEVKETARRTRAALEAARGEGQLALAGGKAAAGARGTAAAAARAAAAVDWTRPRYYRWAVSASAGLEFTERIIRVTDVAVDPLAVAKVRRRDVRIAAGDREEARRELAQLRQRDGSPPRDSKAPKEELQAWRVPGAISNWKTKGLVVPLELRVAVERARGVGEAPAAVNAEGFLALAEALADAEDTAREDVGRRAAERRDRAAREWEAREAAMRDQARTVRAERSKVHENDFGDEPSRSGAPAPPTTAAAAGPHEDLDAFLEACARGEGAMMTMAAPLPDSPRRRRIGLHGRSEGRAEIWTPPQGQGVRALPPPPPLASGTDEGALGAGPPKIPREEVDDDDALDALYDARLFDKARELRGIGGLSAPYDAPLFSGARGVAEARYRGPQSGGGGEDSAAARPGLGYGSGY